MRHSLPDRWVADAVARIIPYCDPHAARHVLWWARLHRLTKPRFLFLFFLLSTAAAICIQEYVPRPHFLNYTTYQTLLTPILLATASLVLSSANRNANIADRTRTCTKDVKDSLGAQVDKRRQANLKHQILAFNCRFRLNGLSIAYVIAGVALFVSGYLAILNQPDLSSPGTFLSLESSVYVRASFSLWTIALALWTLDVLLLGSVTLNLDAYHALQHSANQPVSMRLQQASVVSDYNQRFDAILLSIASLQSAGDRHALLEVECLRFWNLQRDQYEAIQQGLLPARVFTRWMCHRMVEWRRNEFAFSTTSGLYRDCWDRYKVRNDGTDFGPFVNFMEQVHTCDSSEAVAKCVAEELNVSTTELLPSAPSASSSDRKDSEGG